MIEVEITAETGDRFSVEGNVQVLLYVLVCFYRIRLRIFHIPIPVSGISKFYIHWSIEIFPRRRPMTFGFLLLVSCFRVKFVKQNVKKLTTGWFHFLWMTSVWG